MENGLTLYGSFIKEIKDLIYRRQYEAIKLKLASLVRVLAKTNLQPKVAEISWSKICIIIIEGSDYD